MLVFEYMAIPKFYETMLPILKTLEDGKERSMQEVCDILQNDYFNLTEEDKREKVSNGYSRFFDRVSWGRTYLKKAGLVSQPRRGFVQITEEGSKVNAENHKEIDLNFLKKYSSFVNFVSGNKNKEEFDSDIEISVSDKLSPQDMIDVGFRNISNTLKSDLLEKLQNSDPYFFEKVVLILFQKMGYGDFQETPKSRDGGVDGIISQDKLGLEKIYIQAKRYSSANKVREPEIRNFIGAMSGDVSKGIFVTTSNFDDSAIKKAKDAHNHKIVLLNGDELTDLMIKNGVGVQTQTNYEVKEIDNDFFGEN